MFLKYFILKDYNALLNLKKKEINVVQQRLAGYGAYAPSPKASADKK